MLLSVDGDQSYLMNPAMVSTVVSSAPAVDAPKVAVGAAHRQWTDMNPMMLMATVSLTTAAGSFASHPMYLVLARQQCHQGERVSFGTIAREIARKDGVRGFFRGCAMGCFGMIASQSCYYALVDMWKQFGTQDDKASRDFSAGVVAEAATTPLYNPFSVICQRQMVAGYGVASHETYANAISSTRALLTTAGPRAMFRGMGISFMMLPVGGCWWALYEYLKTVTYTYLQELAGGHTFQGPWAKSMPVWAVSTTDNVLSQPRTTCLSILLLVARQASPSQSSRIRSTLFDHVCK
ncbi:mitochondrial carrier protein, putative [Bodo saltans]|uniref:Mitochondrial carrier protein, putative n=1 Tax=Bodo saltans TaxID=75058 RepID=A0A0S4IIT7_BODSA|nr:mitochondrial carrier protein, putative [Bodo saltans]|eukprot:CUE73139.1 mitochondrial carrier protein, putative [Bodo saltans]